MSSRKKIIIPVDFSEMSLLQFHGAEGWVVNRSNTEWILFHAISRDSIPLIDNPSQLEEEKLSNAKAHMTLLIENLSKEEKKKRPPSITGEVRVGAVAESICQFAAEKKADLIVMPARSRSTLPQFIPGNVTDRVLKMAPCPVLVLPGPKPRRNTDRPPLHNEGRIEQLVTMALRLVKESEFANLKQVLSRLKDVAFRHFAYEESPTGLYAEITERHPQLHDLFEKLKQEHDQIRTDLKIWINSSEEEIEKKKDDLISTLELMQSHEMRERDSILEAYYEDIVGAN